MNEAIRVSKGKAAKAVQEYRNEILKEFLLKSKSLSKKLIVLIENSVDDERHVCLEDADVNMEFYYYTVLNRKNVSELKAVLDNMNESNAIESFETFTSNSRAKLSDMLDYQDYVEMEDLAQEYKESEDIDIFLR